MKRILLIFCFIQGICFIKAQSPFIGTATVIPQNPTPVDFIKIVTKVTTGNQSIIVDMTNHTVNGQQINVRGCYAEGMLPATQTYIDTLMVGQLPAGAYQIIHKAYLSAAQQWCNKIDSNSVTTPLQVSGTTSIHKNPAGEMFKVYPNPASGKLYIRGNSPPDEVYIFSSLGALVLKTQMGNNKSIDIRDLPDGFYFIRISNQDREQTTRFVKAGAE